MIKRLLLALGLAGLFGVGALTAQQSNVTNAVVIAALQAMGLFGDGYANGDVPVWVTASNQYQPSSTAGMVVTVNPSTCATPAIRELGALTTGLAFTLTPGVQICTGGSARLNATSAGVYVDTLNMGIATGDIVLTRITGPEFNVSASSTAYLAVNTGGVRFLNGATLGWSSGASAATDLVWARQGANYVFQRNGSNAQRQAWANTYASTVSFESFDIDWQTVANLALTGTRTAATGTQRELRLVSQAANAANNYSLVSISTGPFVRLDKADSGLGAINATTTGNFFQIGGAVISTATSGTIVHTAILPVYNQASGNAANTDFKINRTETAVGSGAQYLIQAQVGGVDKMTLNNGGSLALAGNLSGNQVLFDASSNNTIGKSTANGLMNFTNNAATVGIQFNEGTAEPTVTSCGTGSVTSGSRNTAGEITATGATSCTVTFGAPAWTNTPFCVIEDETSAVSQRISAISTTAFTVTALTSGDKFMYHCIGRI